MVGVNRLLSALALAAALISAGCELSASTNRNIDVRIDADGKVLLVSVPAETTVAEALRVAGISVGNLDRSEPPSYTVLRDGDEIHLLPR